MKDSRLYRTILLAAGIWAAAALVLRLVILKTAYGSDGLVPAGSHALLWMMLLLLAGFGALTVLCLRTDRAPGTEACFPRGRAWDAGLLAAAGLLLVSCLLRLITQRAELDRLRLIAELVGLVAAPAMGAAVLYRERLGKAAFWLQLPLQLYALANLILRFRNWSHDPMILELAPELLFWICAAVASAQLPGFPLGAGHRRGARLWGLCAGVMAVMNLPDLLTGAVRLADLAAFPALGLWFTLHALLLLRPGTGDK